MSQGTRKLVAIMFTDIAGYTAMMGDDEGKAVRALEVSRRIVREQVAKHGGELLEEIGDGSLSSFGSAVTAVECSREIQQIVGSNPDFDLRIGIHIGDVLVSGSQVIGDGVNVASRIHGLADPGAICISDQVYHSVSNHPEFAPQLLGERVLKNVERAITVYVMSVPGGAAAPSPAPAPPEKEGGSRRLRRWGIAAAVLLALGTGAWATGLAERAALALLVNVPLMLSGGAEQEISFVTSFDGTRIAYATSGQGPAMVQVLGWATHVERGIDSPAYNPGVARWAQRFQYVRYDGRGAGLSDRNVTDFSIGARIADLEAVIDGLGLENVILYALSAGSAAGIGYTVLHPENVKKLVLVGGAASPTSVRRANPIVDSLPSIIRAGWGTDNVAARQMFTSLIIPDAPPIQHAFMNELLGVSMHAEDAANFVEALFRTEAELSLGAPGHPAYAQRLAELREALGKDRLETKDLLHQIRVPTLVIHARGDMLIPYEAGGRELAAAIPDARLVVLESNNHGIPPTDPEYEKLVQAVDEFVSDGEPSS